MEKLLSSIWWKIFLFALSLTFLGLALFAIYDTLDDFLLHDFSLTCISIYDYIGRSSVILVFFYVSGVLGLYPLPEFCYHRYRRFTWKWWQNVQLHSPAPELNHNLKLNGSLQEYPASNEPLPNGPKESTSSTTNPRAPVKVATGFCPIGDREPTASLNKAETKLSSSTKSNELGKGLPFLKNHRRGRTSDRSDKFLFDDAMKYRTRDMGFYYLEPSYRDLCKPSLPGVSHQNTPQPSILHRRSNSQNFSVKSVQRSNSQNVLKVATSQNYSRNVPIPQNVVIRNVLKKSNSQSVGVQNVSDNFNRKFGSVGNAPFKLKTSFI